MQVLVEGLALSQGVLYTVTMPQGLLKDKADVPYAGFAGIPPPALG